MTCMVVRQSPDMVGRTPELEQIRAALAETATREQPVVVLVSGEAGIGKSRLVAAACASCDELRIPVLIGRCVALGGQVAPIAAVRDIVIGLLDVDDEQDADGPDGDERKNLERLLPDRANDDPLPTSVLVDLVAGAIRRRARHSPIVVVIEDLHWADETTRRLVATLAGARWLGPVTTLITYRADELHRRHPLLPVVEEIVRAVRPVRVELDRLGLDDVRQLCDRITSGALDAAAIARIHHRSNGNPFLVEEILGSADAASVSDTLRGVLLARVGSLDEAATRVLQTVAMAGELHADVVGDVCQLDAERLDQLIESLRVAGLVIVTVDERLAFRHELAREVFADVAPGTRSLLHAELAAALEARPDTPAGEIARHWFEAHDHTRAFAASIRAARDALHLGAAAEAFDHFGRVLDLWHRVDLSSHADADHVSVLLEASVAALHANHLDTGIELAERALGEIDDDVDREIEVLLRLRTLYRYSSRWGDCTRVVDRLGELVPASPPSRARSLWLVYAALEHYYRNEDGSALADAAVAVAEACDDREALVEARSVLAIWMPADRRLEYLLATDRLARTGVRPEFALRAVNTLVLVFIGLGRLREALSSARRGFSLATTSGLPGPHGVSMAGYMVQLQFLLGDWNACEEFAARHRDMVVDEPMSSLDLIRVRRGDVEGVPAMLVRLEAEADRGVWHEGFGQYVAVAAELAAAAEVDLDIGGLCERALQLAEHGLPIGLPEMLATVLDQFADRVDAANAGERITLRLDLVRRAEAWIDRLDALVATEQRPVDRPYADHAHAALHRLRGDDDPAMWASVAESYEACELPYEEAVARFRAANTHLAGERGRSVAAHEAAAEQCRRAVEVAERLGATMLLERIDELRRVANLAAAGSAASVVDPESSEIRTGSSYGLTDRELSILTLVADGKSNGQIGEALFISTKTASTHVSNILRKLGVANRVEAATAAHRHGLLHDRP